MRVAVFKSLSASNVERDINNFIAMNNYEIIDIKWASSSDGFSALIIYKP